MRSLCELGAVMRNAGSLAVNRNYLPRCDLLNGLNPICEASSKGIFVYDDLPHFEMM